MQNPDHIGAERTSGRAGPGPDPGSPGAARVTWVLVVLLLAAVVALQQGVGRVAGHKAGAPGGGSGSGAEVVAAPEADQQLIVAKLAVKLARVEGFRGQMGPITKPLTEGARTPLERVRAAMVVAEVEGWGPGAEGLLQSAEKQLKEEDAALRGDVGTLRAIYAARAGGGGGAAGAVDAGAAASAEAIEQLKTRHGYYGRLAATYGREDADPERAGLVRGGAALAGLLLGVAGVVGVVVFAGLVLGIVAVVMVATGSLRARFVSPGPGGSVLLEMLAVFMLGFVALKGVSLGLYALAGPEAASVGTLFAQWTLLGVVFYPLLRGVSWGRTRDLLGLRAPRGVLREVGAGVVGYLACVPILIASVLATLLANVIWEAVKSGGGGGGGPAVPENPVLEYFASGSVFEIVMLGLLGTIWAPLCEEMVFRGATLRHLSGRLHPVVAAVPTAVIFALMHGYPILLMGPVLGLGFSFGLLRYWRGSLIPCITAHALHNGAVMALLITLTTLLRD